VAIFRRRSCTRRLVLAAGSLLAGAPARAEECRARSVKLVVGFQAGGGTDVLALAFAEAARKHFPYPLRGRR